MKIIVVLILALAVFCFVVYRVTYVPKIVDYAKYYATSKVVDAVNNSVFCAAEEIDVSTLVTFERDENGNVVLVSTNASAVSMLSGKTLVNVQNGLRSLNETSIHVPIGTVSTSPIFIGLGPNVNIDFSPITYASCKLQSSFTSAGINQTLHKLYLNVTVTFDVVIPTCTTSVQIETPVLISENVIIGNVPEVYFNDNK